jgi:hypothetical protein
MAETSKLPDANTKGTQKSPNRDSLISVRQVINAQPNGLGSPILEIRNPAGISMDILLDRCFDIGWAQARGAKVCWTSPMGFRESAAFDSQGFGWTKTFGGGLLTTCGLVATGAPGVINGKLTGLHGRVGHLPVSNFNWHVMRGTEISEDSLARLLVTQDRCNVSGSKADPEAVTSEIISHSEDAAVFVGEAEVIESDLGSPTLVLYRRILVDLHSAALVVHDEVVNESSSRSPHMFRHHINLGYPLIDEGTVLTTDAQFLRDRDGAQGRQVKFPLALNVTNGSQPEEVLYCATTAREWCRTAIENEAVGLTCEIACKSDQFPMLLLWRDSSRDVNVLGVEPSTSGDGGPQEAERDGRLRILEPWQRVSYTTLIRFGDY